MKKYIISILVAVTALISGCGDGYLDDGGVHNPYYDMTTYEFLQTNPIFDTLVFLIDKADLKETINGDVTFFAPTDYSIMDYVKTKRADVIALDPFADFTIDDIPVQDIRDSLLMYVIPGKVDRDDMSEDGKVYTTLMGNNVAVNLIPIQDEYADLMSVWPEYVFFTTIFGEGLDDPDETVPPEELDQRNRIQTSGIETNTGAIHVIENSHTMWYFVQKNFSDL